VIPQESEDGRTEAEYERTSPPPLPDPPFENAEPWARMETLADGWPGWREDETWDS